MRLLAPRTLVCVTVVACVAMLILVPYFVPKRQPFNFSSGYIGYYHGLGWTEGGGYFGKNWFRVLVTDDIDGYWEVDVSRLAFNRYRGFYSNGKLREEGFCMVEEIRGGEEIIPNRHNLRDAKFYDPSGKLISEVRNTTGKQVLCRANGEPFWELDLLNGQYLRLNQWHANGQIAYVGHYRNGKQHGLSSP